jgi:hypothetical protein
MGRHVDPEMLPEPKDVFGRIFGEPKPVNSYYRILSLDEPEGYGEFFSTNVGAHILKMSTRIGDFDTHTNLFDKTSKILERIYTGYDAALIVPAGAMPISHALEVILRDIDVYSMVFRQLGETLSEIESCGMGLPKTKTPLHSFVFSVNPELEEGMEVLFVPPYNLNMTETKESFLASARKELTGSEEFTIDQADFLADQIAVGWDGVDD